MYHVKMIEFTEIISNKNTYFNRIIFLNAVQKYKKPKSSIKIYINTIKMTQIILTCKKL